MSGSQRGWESGQSAAGCAVADEVPDALRKGRLIVLGTGTGVGKTHVACALAQAWAEAVGANRVRACKPVESGVVAGLAEQSDGQLLEAATLFHVKQIDPSHTHEEHEPTRDAASVPSRMSEERAAPSSHPPLARPAGPPYRFVPAVSPHLAARRIGVRIDLGAIRHWARVRQGDGSLLIETAGGAYSPLGLRTTNLDLACALAPATWLIVAPDRLGVLHDVTVLRTALDHLDDRRPFHLVLSSAPPSDDSTGTNAAEIERLEIARPLGVFPPAPPAAPSSQAVARSVLAALGFF